MRSSSFSVSRRRSLSAAISAGALAAGTESSSSIERNSRCSLRARFSAVSPESASMRRTPEATPRSDTMRKPPISPVLRTWQPPQSSRLNPGTSTERTRSPYFSPNSAMAPCAIASAYGRSSILVATARETQSRTASSIASRSSSVSGRSNVKSKRRRSGCTSDPAWRTPSPSRWRSDAWSRWVAVWLRSVRRRSASSTASVSVAPTSTLPASTTTW